MSKSPDWRTQSLVSTRDRNNRKYNMGSGRGQHVQSSSYFWFYMGHWLSWQCHWFSQRVIDCPHSIWWPTSSLERAWQTHQEVCFSNCLCLSQPNQWTAQITIPGLMLFHLGCPRLSSSLAGLYNRSKFAVFISKCFFRQLLLCPILPSAQPSHIYQTAFLTSLLDYSDLFWPKSPNCPLFLKDAEN